MGCPIYTPKLSLPLWRSPPASNTPISRPTPLTTPAVFPQFWQMGEATTLIQHLLMLYWLYSDVANNNCLMALCPGLPGWAGTRRNIHPLSECHSHLCWSSNILYQPPPSTMIYSILPDQVTCLTVCLHNLSPCHLWSTSWSGTLHFILHKFLHPIIVFFLQYMSIPLQPVLL